MFNDNWFVFLLVVMLAFSSDGTMSSTEIAVMLAILFALAFAGPTLIEEDTDVNRRCFCNR